MTGGHRYPANFGGHPAVPAVQTGEAAAGQPWIGVTADNLKGILRTHPRTTFKIKPNGYFSGRFVDPFKDEPSLLVIGTAASTSEYSWGRSRRGSATRTRGA